MKKVLENSLSFLSLFQHRRVPTNLFSLQVMDMSWCIICDKRCDERVVSRMGKICYRQSKSNIILLILFNTAILLS